MIFRNSVFGIIRTPGRTLLFLLLITCLTAFLSQGIAMYAGSMSMLAEADDTFTTVIQVDYLGMAAQEGWDDQAMQQDLKNFDLSRLAEHPSVVAIDMERQLKATIPGLQIVQQHSPFQSQAMIRFSVNHFFDDGSIVGITRERLFGRLIRENVYISLSPTDLLGNPLAVTLVKGHEYLAFGHLTATRTPTLRLTVSPTLSQDGSTDQAALDSCPGIIDLTEHPDYLDSTEGRIWRDLAAAYVIMDNALPVTSTSCLEAAEPFFMKETYLTDGRMFDRLEYDSGSEVCLISDRLAGLLALTIGDKIRMQLHYNPSGDPDQSYRTGQAPDSGFAREADYRIVGTFKDTEDLQFQIYIPRADWIRQDPPSGQLARLIVRNGQADRYMADMAPSLLPAMHLTVFDQGYGEAIKPILALRAMALRLTLLTLAAGLAILILFVHLSIARQQETVRIMLDLGSGRLRTFAHLFWSCSLIAVMAALSGSIIGSELSGQITQKAWESLQLSEDTDLRFSIRRMGPLVDFSVKPVISGYLAWIAGGIVVVLSSLLTLLVAHRTMKAQLPETRSRRRLRRKKQRTPPDVRESGRFRRVRSMSLRFAIKSIGRNRTRSLIIPLIVCVLSGFIVALSLFGAFQARQLATVYERVPVHAWFSTYLGTRTYHFGLDKRNDIDCLFDTDGMDLKKIKLPNPLAGNAPGMTPGEALEQREQMLAATEDIKDVALSVRFKYELMGKLSSADGTVHEPELPAWPEIPPHNNNYGYDWFIQKVTAMQDVLFADDIRLTPDFLFQEPTLTWLDGYDAQSLKQDQTICILPDDLLLREGYALGDTIRLTTYYTLMDSVVFLDVWDLQIVGTYERQTRSATIYVPWLLCFANEFIPDNEAVSLAPDQPIVQVLPGEWLVNSVYSAVLTLDQTEHLGSFRDRIEALGFTQVGKLAGRRIAIIIADKELEETVQTLKRQKQLMQILTPVVFLLTAVIAFIVSWLLSRHRIREYALMRSLGTRHGQSFLSFLLEQSLLFCAGLLPAGLFLLIRPEAITASGVQLLLFAACYLVGTTLSISLMRRRSVLDILQAKE